MEDDFDSEVIRLRKLVEDSLLQAEKENMVILQSSNSLNHLDTSQSVLKNKMSCPHVKPSLPSEQTGSFNNEKDLHSRIHFLNSAQTSLLSTFNKRRIMNESKNKYIPCAIPLSPPIRLKRDTDENVTFLENIQNNSLMQSPFIHSCGKSSPKCSHGKFSPENVSNTSLKNGRTLIEKNFPSMTVNATKKSYITTEKEYDSQVKNVYENASVIFKDESSVNKNDKFISNKKLSVPNEVKLIRTKQEGDLSKGLQVPESRLTEEENSKDDKNGKDGFHLQISLDSCSMKDAISKMLNKIPEIVNKFEATSTKTKEVFCSGEEKKEEECPDILFSKPNKIISQQQIHTVSSSTQTINESSRNINAFNGLSKMKSYVESSSTLTDKNEDLPIKKHELQCMVKEIVLDTLKSIQIYDNLPSTKMPSTNQKTDSGIQTEEENDVPGNVIVEAYSTESLLKQGNDSETRNHLSVSGKVQIGLEVSEYDQIKHVSNESSPAEFPTYSYEMLQRESTPCYTRTDTVNAVSENNSTPSEKSNVELMLEKIYEQVCKEKELSKDFTDNQFNNSIYTRDVAVQFNPLHTINKSTSTIEVKQVDMSCQYDALTESYSIESKNDVSVQVENCIKNFMQGIDVCTQYDKQEYISDAVTQTEVIADLEHSTTNTSASTTPVSESMFMDDLLSEGEIALPWNLRLLSLSCGATSSNNPDSSDASIKEKDYSLSEGEIHPSVVHYLNLCPFSHNSIEDENSQNDTYPMKCKFDSKPGASTSVHFNKHGFTSAHSKKLQLQVSNSFISENENNTSPSLSLGEVSPSFFKVPLMDSSHVSENHPTKRSADERIELSNDNALFSTSSITDVSNPSIEFAHSENDAVSEQDNLKNSSLGLLQTVDEEVHTMFQ